LCGFDLWHVDQVTLTNAVILALNNKGDRIVSGVSSFAKETYSRPFKLISAFTFLVEFSYPVQLKHVRWNESFID
jgi:hypothetical protein